MNIHPLDIREIEIKFTLRLMKSLETKLSNLRKLYCENLEEIKHAELNAVKGSLFLDCQKRDQEIKNELAMLCAKLENDRRFQKEIKNGLCPILSERCLNLSEEETLDSFVSNQFKEIESKIELLELEQKDISVVVKAGRLAENAAAALPILLRRRNEIIVEGKSLRLEQDSLRKNLEDELRAIKLLRNEKSYSKAEYLATKESNCNVGSNLLRIAKFLFSEQTYREIFLQKVGDWREEYILALNDFKLFRATWVSVRNYADFIYWMLICSKTGKVFDWIIKIVGILLAFFAFWK